MEIIAKANQIGSSSSSNMIMEYIANVSIMNKLTANEYHARLDIFRIFVKAKYYCKFRQYYKN